MLCASRHRHRARQGVPLVEARCIREIRRKAAPIACLRETLNVARAFFDSHVAVSKNMLRPLVNYGSGTEQGAHRREGSACAAHLARPRCQYAANRHQASRNAVRHPSEGHIHATPA